MELTFLGTCGEIDQRTRHHRRHGALLVRQAEVRILIDGGANWLGRIAALRPTAVVLTHAHPDHAWGLAQGAPCPVYATAMSWRSLAGYPIEDRRLMPEREPIAFGNVSFEAFPVDHSTRAPAVGYRLSSRQSKVFYAPDVVAIRERAAALRRVDLYVGDGAAITRSLVRHRDGILIGHTPIRTQLGWCCAEGVPRALFTHCGSEIVGGDERVLGALVRRLGRERGVDARIACDGLRISLDC